jgi:hypothetical protein
MKTEYYEPVSYEDIMLKIDEVVRHNNMSALKAEVDFNDNELEEVDKARLKSAFKEPKSWRSIRSLLSRFRVSSFEIKFPGKAKIILKYGDELIINVY